MKEKDLVKLVKEGCIKLHDNPDSDLTPREVQKLVQDFHLKGTNEVVGVIGAVYAIGYEQGHRDAQEAKNTTQL